MSPDIARCPLGEGEYICPQLRTTVIRKSVTLEKEIYINKIEAVIEPLYTRRRFCVQIIVVKDLAKLFPGIIILCPFGKSMD